MEPWRERVVTEYKELSDKCDKLVSFILSRQFEELNGGQRNLLHHQIAFMEAYRDVLQARLYRP